MLDMIRFWSNFFHENPLDIGEIVKNKFMRHFQNKADIFYFMFFLFLCSDHLSKIASSILTLFKKCTIPSQYSNPDIKKCGDAWAGGRFWISRLIGRNITAWADTEPTFLYMYSQIVKIEGGDIFGPKWAL